MAEIGDITVNGLDYTVDVDDKGRFSVDAGPVGKAYGWSMDEVRRELQTKMRKASVRVNLEATEIEPSNPAEIHINDVVFVGIHGRTGHLLYRDAQGKAQQLEGYTGTLHRYFRRLPPEAKRRAAELIAAVLTAEQARDDFLKPYQFFPDVRNVLRQEIENMTAAAGVVEAAGNEVKS